MCRIHESQMLVLVLSHTTETRPATLDLLLHPLLIPPKPPISPTPTRTDIDSTLTHDLAELNFNDLSSSYATAISDVLTHYKELYNRTIGEVTTTEHTVDLDPGEHHLR